MKKYFYLSFVLILCVGCGRKQKDLFYFPDKTQTLKINKLMLPCVMGVSLLYQRDGIKINWRDIDFKAVKNKLKNKELLDFIGYNIYKLVRSDFIPKKPLNKEPIKKNFFIDAGAVNLQSTNESCRFCYLVKAVFVFNKKVVEGPTSRVVCFK